MESGESKSKEQGTEQSKEGPAGEEKAQEQAKVEQLTAGQTVKSEASTVPADEGKAAPSAAEEGEKFKFKGPSLSRWLQNYGWTPCMM